jgi:hypothetical protein
MLEMTFDELILYLHNFVIIYNYGIIQGRA